MSPDLSRRSAAKGAAWAVPAISVAGAAPALAVSSTVTSASVCKIYEGSGDANGLTTNVHFALGTADGTPIKRGTTFVFDITLNTGRAGVASGAPMSSYGNWMTGVVSNVVMSGSTTTFRYTITVTSDNSASGNCEAYLYWDRSAASSNKMAPNTTVTVVYNSEASAPASNNGKVEGGSLSFNTGSRQETSVNNPTNLRPVNFLSKEGAQICYPLVQFSRIYTNYNRDAQVCVNGGSCQLATPASGTSQMQTAAIC